jgi:hypothetical protein
MNVEPEIIVAVIGTIGALLTGILTWVISYRTANNADKRLDLDSKKEAVSTQVEVGKLNLQLSETQQKLYLDCLNRQGVLQGNLDDLNQQLQNCVICSKGAATRIRDVMERHIILSPGDCPGYDRIQMALEAIAVELEEGTK